MRDNSIIKDPQSTINHKLLSIGIIFLILFSFAASAVASPLVDRLNQFPQWQSKPSVQFAKGDLEYPEWMSGTWNATSTLVEQIAPLAPDIVTPGFEGNENYLNKAIAFKVRFGTKYYVPPKKLLPAFTSSEPAVVADRAFNGKSIGKAYLGDENVYQVKVDPNNPNQQITFLTGERKLVSKITGRASETPEPHKFIATEVTQQFFTSPTRIYLNEVETTSSYRLLASGDISAEQMTAIYLSPQDPDYFKAGDRPVALYRYHLDLNKIS